MIYSIVDYTVWINILYILYVILCTKYDLNALISSIIFVNVYAYVGWAYKYWDCRDKYLSNNGIYTGPLVNVKCLNCHSAVAKVDGVSIRSFHPLLSIESRNSVETFARNIKFQDPALIPASGYQIKTRKAVADPGFTRGMRQPQSGGANRLFDIIFAEGSMKMKRNGQGRSSLAPLRSATRKEDCNTLLKTLITRVCAIGENCSAVQHLYPFPWAIPPINVY